ncbi:MAG: 50S ribosomal protein L29 [Planctomycetota bacterium]|nr:MAG: 50S ribosomal protein L29 [Planctomycetota bacterium]
MKLDELRGLASEDLERNLREWREELFRLRYTQVSESVENTSARRELRKRIARTHTILRERQLQAQKDG